ncbi:MAG TPA: hypothetical protein VG713_17880 [Pirellulales bacterium]|nr:hypothetical protein [Pirellulales bacterium]
MANATGESLDTIRNRGFSLVEVPDLEPLVVDWDAMYPVEPLRKPLPRRGRERVAA